MEINVENWLSRTLNGLSFDCPSETGCNFLPPLPSEPFHRGNAAAFILTKPQSVLHVKVSFPRLISGLVLLPLSHP